MTLRETHDELWSLWSLLVLGTASKLGDSAAPSGVGYICYFILTIFFFVWGI